MKRTLVTIFGVLLVAGGIAYALEEQWPTDKNANSHHIRNLPAPAGPTEPARVQDVAPGACIPKATGANALPFVCSTANTDYVTPSFTLGGDLSGTPSSANVIRLLESGGPTHLTIGALPNGGYALRSGSTLIGSTTIPYSVLTGAPTSLPPSGAASGDLGGTYPGPTVVAGEWSGTRLTFGALADGVLPKRSGTTLIGATPGTDYTVSVAGANGVTATNVAGAVTVDGGQLVASWPVASVRWYCVDAAGSDANVGYSDTSSADCGTKAKATLAGLGAIFPRACTGHKPVVEVKAGTYTGGLEQVLAGVSGCAANFPLVVATGTNSTAGATAFLGDANDRLNAGGVTATGMFAAGYNPIGTLSASLVQAQKVGGGSPGFSAEPAIPLLVRMRFDAATTTAALRNVSRMVMIVTGADTLTPLSAFPATPAGTDVFYLEQPGVITGASLLSMPGQSTQTSAQIVGFRTSSGTTAVVGGTFIFSFSDFTGLSSARASDMVLRSTYVDEGGTTRTMGVGVRVNGPLATRGDRNGNLVSEAFGVTGAQSIIGGSLVSWGNGTSAWAGLQVSNLNATVGNEVDQPSSLIGARAHIAEPAARIRGTVSLHAVAAGLYCQQSNFSVAALDIAGMGANPAIYVRGTCSMSVADQLTGSSGNTDVGLDLTGSIGSTITLYTQPTVTGTAGDIRLFDGTIATWAQAIGGLVDTNGNRFIGYGSAFPIRRMPAGTTLSGGTLTVPNLVGPGFTKVDSGGSFSVQALAAIASSGSASDLIAGTVPCLRLSVLTGDVTSSGCAATITANAVTDGKLRMGGPLSVIGRSANSTGTEGDISATSGTGFPLRESGSTIGFGAIGEAAVTNLTTDLAAKQPTVSWGTSGNVLIAPPSGTNPASDSTFTEDTSTHLLSSHHLLLSGTDGSGIALGLNKGGAQAIRKTGSGDLDFGTSGVQALTLTTNGTTRLTLDGTTGGLTLSTLGTGLVKSTSGLLANATAGTDYVHSASAGTGTTNVGTAADPIIGLTSAWPAASDVVVSTSTGPTGDSTFQEDTSTHLLKAHHLQLTSHTASFNAIELSEAASQGILKTGAGDLVLGTSIASTLQLISNGTTRLFLDSAGLANWTGAFKLSGVPGVGTAGQAVADSTGAISFTTAPTAWTLPYYIQLLGGAGAFPMSGTGMATSSTQAPTAMNVEYQNTAVTPNFVRLSVNLLNNANSVGTGTYTIEVTRNGTTVPSATVGFSQSSAAPQTDDTGKIAIGGGGSASDTFGLKLTSTGSFVQSNLIFTANLQVTTY